MEEATDDRPLAELERAAVGGVGTSQQLWGQEVGKLDNRKDLSPCALEGICVIHLLKAASTCLQLRFDLRGRWREKSSV